MQLDSIYATYDWRENQGVDKFKYCPLCGTPLERKQILLRPRSYCPACGFIFYRNPFPTVSVLVHEGNKVLLGKRLGEPGKNKWALPSGYVEFEEDFLSTAIREVKEETGLAIEITSILNVQSTFLLPEYHFLSIFLLAQEIGGSLAPGDDVEEVRWFSIAEPLPEMAFEPDGDLIQKYFNGQVESIRVQRRKGLEPP